MKVKEIPICEKCEKVITSGPVVKVTGNISVEDTVTEKSTGTITCDILSEQVEGEALKLDTQAYHYPCFIDALGLKIVSIR